LIEKNTLSKKWIKVGSFHDLFLLPMPHDLSTCGMKKRGLIDHRLSALSGTEKGLMIPEIKEI
jgi:hypothetical protein